MFSFHSIDFHPIGLDMAMANSSNLKSGVWVWPLHMPLVCMHHGCIIGRRRGYQPQ